MAATGFVYAPRRHYENAVSRLPGLLLIASGYGIAEQTLLPVAQNSRDVMLLPCVGDPPNDLPYVSVRTAISQMN